MFCDFAQVHSSKVRHFCWLQKEEAVEEDEEEAEEEGDEEDVEVVKVEVPGAGEHR